MPVTDVKKCDLLLVLYNAFIEVFDQHRALFEYKVSERDVCAHILSAIERAMDMRDYWFNDYFVDVEYNRGPQSHPKMAMMRGRRLNVVPDIVIHGRGDKGPLENLLCVEVKKSWASGSAKSDDKRRLEAFTMRYDDFLIGEWPNDIVDNYVVGVYLEYSVNGLEVFEVFYQGNSLGSFRSNADFRDDVTSDLMLRWFLLQLRQHRG